LRSQAIRCPEKRGNSKAHLVALYRADGHTIGEIEDLFAVTRSTVYRPAAEPTRQQQHRTRRSRPRSQGAERLTTAPERPHLAKILGVYTDDNVKA
jgi:transposase